MPDHIVDSNDTTFEYDGDHARVLKESNNVQQTLYAGNLYERVDDGLLGGAHAYTHKYRIFAMGKQVAQIERKEVGGGSYEQKLLYLHGDNLGSTQLVTDGDGGASSNVIVHEQTFDPWGKPEGPATWEGGPSANVHAGFTGHEHDPEHGLINMRGRIYDPELGRFTTPDPFVQAPFYRQSLNRYAYVFNNPLRYVDPSGYKVPHRAPLQNQVSASPRSTVPTMLVWQLALAVPLPAFKSSSVSIGAAM